MAHGGLNPRLSGTDHTTTTTKGLTKGRMVRALRNGLVLSFELSILILLLFLRVVELVSTVSTRCLAVLAQSANQPTTQYSKNPRCRPQTEDYDLNGPQQPPFKIPASRTSLMRSSSSVLPETSTTQHKGPAPSRKAVKEHEFPGIDSVNEVDIRHDGCLLPVTPSRRSVLCRPHNMPESIDPPTSVIIPTRHVNPGQVAHKRHQTTWHHDSEGNLQESASTSQEGNVPNAFSTISISRKAIELQPSVVEPSLFQNPLSPPRPVAHIELPRRRVSGNLTHDTQPVLRSVEDGSPKLTDSLSYLRTLAKAKKATAASTSAISTRYQSHKNVPSTIP